jgi:hypothetical protein
VFGEQNLRYGDTMKRWLTGHRTQLALAALLICSGAISGRAQSSKQSSLPRIGTIKDYPATGLMTGCGNLYFHQADKSKVTDADFVFLARGDGSNAWMNLNGRDVRLRQIKTRSAKHKPGPYSYRYGNWQITVAIEDLTIKNPAAEADPMYQMKITFRKGRSVRIIHAAGDSDC